MSEPEPSCEDSAPKSIDDDVHVEQYTRRKTKYAKRMCGKGDRMCGKGRRFVSPEKAAGECARFVVHKR